MHCSREGHDRVEMQLLNEDLGSGTQILKCPKCGWEAKMYGSVAAASVAPAPKLAQSLPQEPSKRSAPRTQHTSFKSLHILTVVMLIAVIGGIFYFARDVPIPGYGVGDSDVTGGNDFAVSTQPEDWETVDGATPAVALGRSCNAGNAADCYRLGGMYASGTGVGPNSAAAARLFEAACGGGVVAACGRLGTIYSQGIGVTRDLRRADHFYQLGCDGGMGRSCSELGYIYFAGEGLDLDYNKAAALFERACNDGDGYGCSILATMYDKGIGVARDASRAAELNAAACSTGDSLSAGCKRR